MNKTVENLIYLLSCAVNEKAPDAEQIGAMDLNELYKLSKEQTLRGAVYIALRNAGVKNDKFFMAYNKAVRKNVMHDVERTAILGEFEKQGIWYMPLKGSIIKELYPENGMREMSDNDILYDSTKQQEVKKIMLAMNYTAESVGHCHHDEYLKPPVLNFEMHTSLFGAVFGKLHDYYADPKRLMIPDDDKKYGFHLSDEDFYVFNTAHEYKHFTTGGTGIRYLLDCYVFMKKKGSSLDMQYIKEQCRQLEIEDFEQQRRQLAIKLFSSSELPGLDDSEQKLLSQYIDNSTYGTMSNYVENEMKKIIQESKHKSKLSCILRFIFPDRKYMETWFPFFCKHKFLLPVGYVWRWIRAIFTRTDVIRFKLKALKDYKSK